MSIYLSASIKLKFGISSVESYKRAMEIIKESFEKEGVILETALMTSIGPQWEMLNIWKLDDANHWQRTVERLSSNEASASFSEALDIMSEIVIEEELRLLNKFTLSK